MLSKRSDIDGEEEVRSSAKVYVKAVNVIIVQKRLDLYQVPEELLSMQPFPPHILYHLYTNFEEEKLSER